MSLQDIFIANLRHFRKKRHLTQEKLAELCGTETSYIGQIETKKRFPSLQFIERLAEALQVMPYLLYKPADEKESLKNCELQDEIISVVAKDISDIFTRHGMS